MEKDILGTEKISALMLKMTVPSIVAQLIDVLYNIVDRSDIGHLAEYAEEALTGAEMTFSMAALFSVSIKKILTKDSLDRI